MTQFVFRPLVLFAAIVACITPLALVAQNCPYNYYPDSIPFIIDGRVNCFLKHGNQLIMGGGFDCITTPNKGVAVVDANGQTLNQFFSPEPGKHLSLFESDGLGGVYASGYMLDKPLVHLMPNGTVSAWQPKFSAQYYPTAISAILKTGNLIIVAGRFDSVNGIVRNNFAVFDATTGNLRSTQVSGIKPGIKQMVLIGSNLYLSGEFDSIGSFAREGLASIDTLSWSVTNWNPLPTGSAYRYFSNSITGNNSTLVVLGEFNNIMNQSRHRLAAFDGNTGNLKPLNPDMNGGIDAIALKGDTLYLAGHFHDINWQPRLNFGAVNVHTGALTSWRPDQVGFDYDYSITTMTIHGNTLYVGGKFNQLAGQSRIRLAAIDIYNGSITSWNPKATAAPEQIVVSQNNIFLGGNILIPIRGTGGVLRKNLASIDTLSGELTNWNPNANQLTVGNPPSYDLANVSALAALGNTLYVGGTFDSIGGYQRKNLAALNATTGDVLNWGVNLTVFSSQMWTACGVKAIAIHDNKVYVGGSFTNAGNQTRNRLATFDALSGNLLPFNPDIDNANSSSSSSCVNTLFKDSNMLYIGGTFSTISSLSRQNAASIDLNTGNVSPWNPGPNEKVMGITRLNGSILLAGMFDSITAGHSLRRSVAAFNRIDGTLLPLSIDSLFRFASSHCMYVNNNKIYLGGDYTHMSGTGFFYKQTGLVQLDSSFRLLNWYPAKAMNWQEQGVDPGGYRISLISCNNFLYSGGLFTGGLTGGTFSNSYSLVRQSLLQPKIITQPVSSIKVCPGSMTYINFTVEGPPAKFTWRKNNTIISTSNEGSLFFFNTSNADSGWYQCTAVSPCSTFQSDSVYVNVTGSKPVVDFSINDTNQCLNNNRFVFTNQSSVSSGSLTYYWTFGHNDIISSEADTSMSYSADGTFTVYLTAYQNGSTCYNYTSKQVVVQPAPVAAISTNDPTNWCGNGSVLMKANTGPELSYQWLRNNLPVGSAVDSHYTATSGGTYNIVESFTNGCNDTSANLEVVMNPLPSVSFTLILDSISESASPFTLSGGLPAGGLYSGKGVTNNDFSPAVAGAGNHIITYTYEDSNGCKDSVSKTVKVFIEPSGVSDISGPFELRAYPNPAHNELFVKLNHTSTDAVLQITDMYGRVIFEQTGVNNATQIDISGLNSGAYFVTVNNYAYALKLKFIKMNF